LFNKGSFKANFWDVFNERVLFYWDVFSNKIFHWRRAREVILLSSFGGYFLIFLPRLIKNDYFKIALLMFMSPLVGLIFFQGNFGNIYDYYLTGYYFIFIMLHGILLRYYNSPGLTDCLRFSIGTPAQMVRLEEILRQL
jgi:hypothetical protein